jgi:hypothetical protein
MTDYTTKAYVKAVINSRGLATDLTDDDVIAQLISAASTHFENETHRVFIAASATRYFDTPTADDDRMLFIDECTGVTSVTNGYGGLIPSTEYLVLPVNSTPKYAIRLKASSSYSWELSTTGDREAAITVVAPWGYSTACPSDVRSAVEAIVVNMYQSRRGQGADGIAQITAAGVIITPKDVPAFAENVIRHYQRHT